MLRGASNTSNPFRWSAAASGAGAARVIPSAKIFSSVRPAIRRLLTCMTDIRPYGQSRGLARGAAVNPEDCMADKSAFNKLVGVRWVTWTAGEAVAELDLQPMHMNRSGWLHGGVLCTLLDTVCSRSGCWTPPDELPRRSSTVSLTTNFLRAAKSGVVRATGRLRPGAGTQIFSAVGEVVDEAGQLLAIAQGTFRYRTKSGPSG
jgi:uncharacterized protein (TIGR00369 family)